MIFVLGNSSGGGGGPTSADAILTVTAPAGATVTATKGSATLTPTLWTAAADATQECALFVISAAQFDATNPWTVAATNGTDTISDTIIIDSNKQYDVELTYNLYLIKDGVIKTTYGNDSGVTIINYSDSIGIQFGSNSNAFWVQLTSTLINNVAYRKLVLDIKSIDNPGTTILWGIRTQTSGGYTSGWLVNVQSDSTMTFPLHSELDISSVSYVGNYFDLMCRFAIHTVDVVNVYLAR